MNVGVMKNYKLRDLRASHTLGWSWNWNIVNILGNMCFVSTFSKFFPLKKASVPAQKGIRLLLPEAK
jgi:hypothetical protein